MKLYNPNEVKETDFNLGNSKTPVVPTSTKWVTSPKAKLDLLFTYMYKPAVNPIWTDLPSFGEILADNNNDLNAFMSATKNGLEATLKDMFTGDIIVEVTTNIPQPEGNTTEQNRVAIYVEVQDVLGVYNTSAILKLENGKLKEMISG